MIISARFCDGRPTIQEELGADPFKSAFVRFSAEAMSGTLEL